MSYAPGRGDDVIIQTTPAPRYRDAPGTSDVVEYDAIVYSHLPLTVSQPTRSRYPDTLRNLPLRGVERLTVPRMVNHWLAAFIEGDKGLYLMRERMVGLMSPGLRDLLERVPLSMRVWWSNTSPELEVYPWELVVHASGRDQAHRVAFLRGLPPENPIPSLPITGHPRLGLIGRKSSWPEWVPAMADEIGRTVVVLDGTVRDGLRRAASEGLEMVHLFTDGTVSSALEGALFDEADTARPSLPAGELVQMLGGTRIVLLALSPANVPNPETMSMSSGQAPSAFRAFTYLGAVRGLPTILAPVGPIPSAMMTTFWSAFYFELRKSWHLTESLRTAQAQFSFSVPIALFARHAGGRLFQSEQAQRSIDPMMARADLIRSQKMTAQLSQLKERFGLELPESVRNLLQGEATRQTRIRGELEGLIDAEGEL